MYIYMYMRNCIQAHIYIYIYVYAYVRHIYTYILGFFLRKPCDCGSATDSAFGYLDRKGWSLRESVTGEKEAGDLKTLSVQSASCLEIPM